MILPPNSLRYIHTDTFFRFETHFPTLASFTHSDRITRGNWNGPRQVWKRWKSKMGRKWDFRNRSARDHLRFLTGSYQSRRSLHWFTTFLSLLSFFCKERNGPDYQKVNVTSPQCLQQQHVGRKNVFLKPSMTNVGCRVTDRDIIRYYYSLKQVSVTRISHAIELWNLRGTFQ